MPPTQETSKSFELRPDDIELSSEGRIVISNPALAATLKSVLEAEREMGSEERRRWNVLCNIHLNYQCQPKMD